MKSVELISFFISFISGCFMLANNLLAKEYSRRGESAFNVEIRIRTHFTKGQPAGPKNACSQK